MEAAEKPPMTFADFVAVRRAKKRQCKLCNSPRRDLVEDAHANGANGAELSDWLRSEYKESISAGAIRDHFKAGHGDEQR